MTEKINAYVELAVDYGQKLNVDLILACGTESIDNQIRFSYLEDTQMRILIHRGGA